MSLVHQYNSTIPSMRYIFKSGLLAHFIAGKYRTADEVEIAELDNEIAKGNPHIYIQADTKVVDTQNDDPLVGLKKKWLAEYLAQNAAEVAKIDAGDTDFGESETKVRAANSNTSQVALASGKKVQASPQVVKNLVSGS